MVGVNVAGGGGGVDVMVEVFVGVREGNNDVELGPAWGAAVGLGAGAEQAESANPMLMGIKDAMLRTRSATMDSPSPAVS
jgi:hypothetical protein